MNRNRFAWVAGAGCAILTLLFIIGVSLLFPFFEQVGRAADLDQGSVAEIGQTQEVLPTLTVSAQPLEAQPTSEIQLLPQLPGAEVASLADLYEQLNPGVVNIKVYVEQEILTGEGAGSGFILDKIIDTIDQQQWLDSLGLPLQRAIKNVYDAGGSAGLQVRDFLHGVWLEHPLHPVLTDIPVGAWTVALVLDTLAMTSGRKKFSKGADVAIQVGLVGAVGSAITGLTDWQHLTGRSRRVGMAHALLNISMTTNGVIPTR